MTTRNSYDIEKYKQYPVLKNRVTTLDKKSEYVYKRVFKDNFDGIDRNFFESSQDEYTSEHVEDFLWEVESGLELRPDLISFRFYNTVKYWWFICAYNGKADPFDCFEQGEVIRIPSLKSIFNLNFTKGLLTNN
jgi:hypothetical protein